jgi:hypothetical protein
MADEAQQRAVARLQFLIEQSQRSQEFLAQQGLTVIVSANVDGWQTVIDAARKCFPTLSASKEKKDTDGH